MLCDRQPALKEVPQRGDARPSRSELIKSAFHALNQSGSGHLSAAEMKPFAEHTGVLPAFLEIVVVCWSLGHIPKFEIQCMPKMQGSLSIL